VHTGLGSEINKAFYESFRSAFRQKELGFSKAWFPTIENKDPRRGHWFVTISGEEFGVFYDYAISWNLY